MPTAESRFDLLANRFNKKDFHVLHETMTFSEYLDRVYKNPFLARSAYQRIYDMILRKGVKNIKMGNKTVSTYGFFSDPQIPVYGLEKPLEQLVRTIRAAACYFGVEKRVILMTGPVGSSKSTICRLLKKELEAYSKTDEGALYSFEWVKIPGDLDSSDTSPCPMHEDPLSLIPKDMRDDFERELNDAFKDQYKARYKDESPYPLKIVGDLCPHCKFYMEELLQRNEGDWRTVLKEHIQVKRIVLSEANRVGIGTFQPKDEKNQDSTELTGEVNFRKLGEIGRDSDPRVFSFDGEFNVSNRGMIEFIEILKLDNAFLYDLLGAAQERQIKPKKFPQVSIDLAIFSHTNMPEFKKLQGDKKMEALKDRTIRIDIPYLLEVSKELKILENDYGPKKVSQHIAPHTLYIVALWLVLTRLQEPKDRSCNIIEKAKLYDGKLLPGWTEDKVKELRQNSGEGIERGMSVRYGQNKIGNCLVGPRKYINAFMVLNEIQEGLANSPLIDNEDDRKHFLACVGKVREELDDILRKEVQEAVSCDSTQMNQLCAKYMHNVVAHIEGQKIINEITEEEEDADERLMRAIEDKIEIPEQNADDFRRSLAAFAYSCELKGEEFKWDSDQRLKKALEKYMFEMSKDTINIAKLNAGSVAVSPENQEKIDLVKDRLIKRFGYNEESATDVMEYVSRLFARGDVVDE